MKQHIQETCRGLRVTIDPGMPTTPAEIEVIRNLLSSHIASFDCDPDVAQCLRYARIHVVFALKLLDKQGGLA